MWTPGDEWPSLHAGPVTLEHLRAYADASGDDNPIHTDEEAARGFGLPGVIAHGMLTMGWMSRQLLSAMTDRGELVELSVRFRSMVKLGDVVTCAARVTDVVQSGDDVLVSLAVSATTQAGDVAVKGTAVVRTREEMMTT
ncbi:MAG: MaoC/PaaZ C-terminal domain-containing protein [Firmicutes bacterium]|nr:MaoC/PaaZ C-terminal domain-containing protein [Bacillota bacterium]